MRVGAGEGEEVGGDRLEGVRGFRNPGARLELMGSSPSRR